MLAGESPAASMTERRVHNWTVLEGSAAMKRADAGVARAVKHAISRALAPLPDDRFPTVTEFATALGGFPHRTSVPTRGVFASRQDRKSTRLNSSHSQISYAVFCLKKKKKNITDSLIVAEIESDT